MARAGIEQYLYLLDAAFAGPDWHALLTNVRALEPDDWLSLPPNGARPIADACRRSLRPRSPSSSGGSRTRRAVSLAASRRSRMTRSCSSRAVRTGAR